MGYTSKEIDEDLYLRDVDLICLLEPSKQELDIKKQAAAVAMAFGGGKATEKPKHGRR